MLLCGIEIRSFFIFYYSFFFLLLTIHRVTQVSGKMTAMRNFLRELIRSHGGTFYRVFFPFVSYEFAHLHSGKDISFAAVARSTGTYCKWVDRVQSTISGSCILCFDTESLWTIWQFKYIIDTSGDDIQASLNNK